MKSHLDISYRNRYFIVVVILTSICLLTFSGCEEKEVPYVQDSEVLERYIYETEEGRDLFRTDNLFLEDEYSIPFDSAVYKTIVDSTHRIISLDVFVDTAKYNNIGHFWYRTTHEYNYYAPLKGNLWDAEMVVDDYFFIRTLRTVGDSTTETSHKYLVTRYAYFVKIGSDSREYLGWKLFGYDGGKSESSAMMEVRSENGTVFRGDNVGYEQFRYTVHWENLSTGYATVDAGYSEHSYMRPDQLGVIEDGSRLYLNSYNVSNESYYQIVSAETDSGFGLQMMHRSDSSHYVDTVKTPDNNSRIWNLLFLSEIERFYIEGSQPPDTMGTNWYFWCVPYRVPK
ncbi:MAG: hypothetical protein U9N55_01475 [candidate division Zixibacteria bacterium]|nr:hypothetical protein [candidate division Zixibacteria bacterium]